MRYRRNARDVDAILFDGTHASAAEISRRIGSVSFDGGRIEVNGAGGRVFAGMGCWIVRDGRTRRLSVIDDREFTAQFEAVDEPAIGTARPVTVPACDCIKTRVCSFPDCLDEAA